MANFFSPHLNNLSRTITQEEAYQEHQFLPNENQAILESLTPFNEQSSSKMTQHAPTCSLSQKSIAPELNTRNYDSNKMTVELLSQMFFDMGHLLETHRANIIHVVSSIIGSITLRNDFSMINNLPFYCFVSQIMCKNLQLFNQ